MNFKKLNEELSKYLNEKLISNKRFHKKKSEADRLQEQKLNERDRTFDDFDCDEYKEIVHGEYGGSMYIVTMNDTYFVYSKDDYGLTKEGKFESYQDALKYIADDIMDREDPYEIEEMMDMGDFDIYDDYVQKEIKSWIEDSQDDEDE